jgi:type 1 fimbria pilin
MGRIQAWNVTTLLMVSVFFGKQVMATDNIRYFGSLVAEPCTLLPSDGGIVVEFDTVIDKYLYLNGRTLSKPFELHLMDCDIRLGNTVSMTFRGMESLAMPGLLALESSQASGIAIGMETQNGLILKLNKPSDAQAIVNGNNVIRLQAYVQGEPDAIKNKKIERGLFTAVATFSLEYE